MNEITKEFLVKVRSILQKTDSDYKWGSDPYINAAAFIQSVDQKKDLIKEIENSIEQASEISELHPQRIGWIIKELQRWI